MTTRPLFLLFALPVLAATAACGTANRGLESVHQPVVARTDMAIDLAASGGTLSSGEAERLDGWFQTVRLGFGDRVAVDAGGGEAGAAAAEVAGVVARYGLLLADQAPVTNAPVAQGSVRVVVSRMRATVPGCPDWSRDSGNEFGGNTHSNFGCATNANLAAMIANPADLVRGQAGSTLTDAAASYKAIDTYRTAKPTGAAGLGDTGVTTGAKK